MSGTSVRRELRKGHGLLGLVLMAIPACSPDVQELAGPRVPVPNVTGEAIRASAPAGGVGVDLRTNQGVEVASTKTDASGRFGFVDVAQGVWEIKLSGRAPGDFESVTRAFRLESGSLTIAAMNIYAFGAAAAEPEDGASLPAPNPTQPLIFRWTLPAVPGARARVQVFEGTGSAVWVSSWRESQEASWDGLGNQGVYQGTPAAPGSYTWRVKFELPDSCEARAPSRRLVLT